MQAPGRLFFQRCSHGTTNKKSLAVERAFQLSLAMRVIMLRRVSFLSASIILMSQIIGLIFCGDAECLQGGSDESCTTLLCGLLAKHSSAAPTTDDDSNTCQCLCHLLIDLPKTNLEAASCSVTQLHIIEALQCFSTPVHDIDHPPLA
jgi:hypothetical protein